jgi:hypothetical protein
MENRGLIGEHLMDVFTVADLRVAEGSFVWSQLEMLLARDPDSSDVQQLKENGFSFYLLLPIK